MFLRSPLEERAHGIAEVRNLLSFYDPHFTFDQRSSERRCDVLRIATALYLGAVAIASAVVDELKPVDWAAFVNAHGLVMGRLPLKTVDKR